MPVTRLKQNFADSADPASYRQWQQRVPDNAQRAPGLRNPSEQPIAQTTPLREPFTNASNAGAYTAAQQKYAPQNAPEAPDNQPEDPAQKVDFRQQYPNIPLSTDKGKLVTLEEQVPGTNGQIHARQNTYYFPDSVLERMNRNQSEGRSALDGVPVIDARHGTGGNAMGILNRQNAAGLANEMGAIVIAPQGLGKDPSQPLSKDNPSMWNNFGTGADGVDEMANNRAAFDHIGVAAEQAGIGGVKPEDVTSVIAYGHSRGSRASENNVERSAEFLPVNAQYDGAVRSGATGGVSGNSLVPSGVGGTQFYTLGMQDHEAVGAVLKDENATKAWLCTLERDEKRAFRGLENEKEKVDFALAHQGPPNEKGDTALGQQIREHYKEGLREVAASQGVTLTEEDFVQAEKPIYKPVLDDKGRPVLDAQGQAAYDTNARIGTRYHIDIKKEDGTSLRMNVRTIDGMGHEPHYGGPYEQPEAIKSALKDDPDLEQRWRNTLNNEQNAAYDGMKRKEQLEFAVNNQGPVDPETGKTLLAQEADKRNKEKYGDPLAEAADTFRQEERERKGLSNDLVQGREQKAERERDRDNDAQREQREARENRDNDGRGGGGRQRDRDDDAPRGWGGGPRNNGGPGLG